jgi:hypothetical protein
MPINLTELGIKYVVKLKLELTPMMLCCGRTWRNMIFNSTTTKSRTGRGHISGRVIVITTTTIKVTIH